MTTPSAAVTPPAIVMPLPWPALGAENYNNEAYAAGAAAPPAFASLVAVADNVATNANIAYDNAAAAQGAAVTAIAARDQALSTANFKDLWENLTGPLNKPASVKHNGRFWLLLNNLADVTASEPSNSNPDWTSNDQGVTPTALITTNTTAVPGVVYLIGAPDLVLTYPTTWIKGDNTGVVELIGAGTYTIDFGTTKERTRTRGAVLIKAGFRSFQRRYEDATRGLV